MQHCIHLILERISVAFEKMASTVAAGTWMLSHVNELLLREPNL